MSKRASQLPDGVLLVDKPAGRTSHDVVQQLRRRVRPKKVGHTGTLDPMATGLLPLTIGEATKLTGLLQGDEKRYLARIGLGTATDTLDGSGSEVARSPVPPLHEAVIREVLAASTGLIEQIPPMYSALHHEGKRLYQLARKGLEVERAARQVTIHRLDLLAWGATWLEVDVACSSGTYVRSLAADLASALGTHGHLESLRRTETSGWSIEAAVGWDRLLAGDLAAHMLPLDAILARFQRVDVSAELALRLSQGFRLSWNQLKELGIDPIQTETLVWFRPPEAQPLILARLLPEPAEPGMDIRRVLCPLAPASQKNIDNSIVGD